MSRSKLIHNRLIECCHKGEVEKTEMIKIIQDVSLYLGLKNLTLYSKERKISVQAAHKHKNIIQICGKYFAVDNE